MKKVALALAVVAMHYLPANGQLQQQYQNKQREGDRDLECFYALERSITHGRPGQIVATYYRVRGLEVYTINIGGDLHCNVKWTYEGDLGKTYRVEWDNSLTEYRLEGGELCVYTKREGSDVNKFCEPKYR